MRDVPGAFKAAFKAVGLGSNLQFALFTLGGIGVVAAFVAGVLYALVRFPWWIDLMLIVSTVALSTGVFLALWSWWQTRDAPLYFAQLTLDHPVLLTTIDLVRGRALVQPSIELTNHLPERLDYEMSAFTLKLGRRTRTTKPQRGVIAREGTMGFSGVTMDLPIKVGMRIEGTLEYDLVYGPGSGDRYLIREHLVGLNLGGVVAADGSFVADRKYTATQPPVTKKIKGGLPK